MMPVLQRCLADTRGAAAVEFALISIVIILFTLVTIDVGRMVWLKNSLQSVAEETARCAAIANSGATGASGCASPVTYAQALAAERSITLAAGDITLTPNDACDTAVSASANFYKIEISYDYDPIVPMLNLSSFAVPVSACFPMP